MFCCENITLKVKQQAFNYSAPIMLFRKLHLLYTKNKSKPREKKVKGRVSEATYRAQHTSTLNFSPGYKVLDRES